MVIGVTGGIACGKSEVCKFLERNGFILIDADDVAHDVLEIPEVMDEIAAYFGPEVINKNPENGDIIGVNRKALGNIVFADAEKMRVLEGITRPRIVRIIKDTIEKHPENNYVVEGIALTSSGLNEVFDELWVVHAEPEQQIRRLTEYRHMTLEEAQDRLKSQEEHDWDEETADRVIYSLEPLEKMIGQVREILETIGFGVSVDK